jgi:hypothetical protein
MRQRWSTSCVRIWSPRWPSRVSDGSKRCALTLVCLGMSIPSGYAVCTFTWTCAGSSRNIVNTWACENIGSASALLLNGFFRNQFVTTASRLYSAASLSSAYTLSSTKVLSNIGGVLTSDEDFTNVAHTGSASPAPMNTAQLLTKQTGIAGRKYRGRVFAPHNTGEINVDAAGIIASGTTAAYQILANNTLAGMNGVSHPLVLLHGDGSAPTTLTGIRVEQKIGTIGRRLRG